MNVDDFRAQWLKWNGAYERYAFKVFRKALKQSFANLPIKSLTYTNYEITVRLNVQPEPISKAYFEVYQRIGLLHGTRVGRGINKDIKNFDLPFFNEQFYKDVLKWLSENAGQRITSVNETTAERISLLIELAQRKNLSIEEMHEFLQSSIDNPSFTKYQALRIARTEVGSAANFAALKAGESTDLVLEKVWVSTHDKRTRDGRPEEWNHLAMDGQRVDQNEPFVMRSNKGNVDYMNTPCDVKGSPGNVINCRCTFASVAKRDSEGFAIRR